MGHGSATSAHYIQSTFADTSIYNEVPLFPVYSSAVLGLI